MDVRMYAFPTPCEVVRTTETTEANLSGSKQQRQQKLREEFSSVIWRPGDTEIVTQIEKILCSMCTYNTGTDAMD
eukprot:6314465-Pyramimonas_sp.AAC.1